jgi:RNA-binding protein
MDKYTLRSRSKRMDTTMSIGKGGLTPSVIAEIKRQLHKRKLIKVKMLSSLADTVDKKAIGKELAEATNAVLIDQIGFVYVLAEKSTVHE